MDCFVASAPRNDERRHSRGAICVRALQERCPSENRGRRECRVLAAPAASRGNRKNHTSVVTTGRRNTPALPAQWLERLLRALPGVSGLLATVARKSSLRT